MASYAGATQISLLSRRSTHITSGYRFPGCSSGGCTALREPEGVVPEQRAPAV